MDGNAESPPERDAVEVDPFPDGLAGGSTVLLAGTVDPAAYAVGLRALCQFGAGDDTALVVTSTESAGRTVERYRAVCDGAERPALGLVDTTSERQSLSALYEEPPTVYVPAPNDLERLVVGLSDLTTARSTPGGRRHLLVRSLTPLLETAGADDVCAILERISGLRTGAGLSLFGIDYVAHDEETMAALSRQVDGVLWITERSGVLEFEFSPAVGRYGRR